MSDNLINKAKKFLLPIDDMDEDEEFEQVPAEEKLEIKYRGVNSFKQVKEVCDCLRQEYPVIINLQSATQEVIVRVTDYLSGVLDAIDGEIVAIGVNMWVCTPKHVLVDGKFVELIHQEAEEKAFAKRGNNRSSQESSYSPAAASPYHSK